MNSEQELVDAIKYATEKERAKMARRLAKLIKDLVYANAHARAEELIRHIYRISSILPGDTLTIDYKITVGGDVIRMLLGGIRRKKK